jgi:hypothetical protein
MIGTGQNDLSDSYLKCPVPFYPNTVYGAGRYFKKNRPVTGR